MSQDNLLPLRIEKCIAERREPGMMVFNVRPGGGADITGGNGWIIGVDQSGHFPLNLKFDTPAQDTCALPNGNLLFSLTGGREYVRMRSAGNGDLRVDVGKPQRLYGLKAAAPDPSGQGRLDYTALSDGTSSATALATRSAHRIFDALMDRDGGSVLADIWTLISMRLW